jgi:heme oxygenase (biliverdin-IX-beta and delta-forming)
LVSPVLHRTPAPAGTLVALRAATRLHHDRVDRLIDLRRLGEAPFYASVLQVFDAFLAAWEARVLAVLPLPQREWLARRSRLAFVRHDLQVLGIDRLEPAPALAALPSSAAAWGSIYVVEGSTLGGQVITRTLARHGLLPHNGAAYFHGWGEHTGGLWRETRTLLERELAPAHALPPACRAACATFDALAELLESRLHGPAAHA